MKAWIFIVVVVINVSLSLQQSFLRGTTIGDLISGAMHTTSTFLASLAGSNSIIPIAEPPPGSIFSTIVVVPAVPNTTDTQPLNAAQLINDNIQNIRTSSPLTPLSNTLNSATQLTNIITSTINPVSFNPLYNNTFLTPLAQILERAGLEGFNGLLTISPEIQSIINSANETHPITILAPLNSAFRLIEPNLLEKLTSDKNIRNDILSNLVLKGAIGSGLLDLNYPSNFDTINGYTHTFRLSPFRKISINKKNIIILKDITGINGIIHIVDSLPLPMQLSKISLSSPIALSDKIFLSMTIADAVRSIPSLSILSKLMNNILQQMSLDSQHWTIFAPSDLAFENLGSASIEKLRTSVSLGELIRSWIYPGYMPISSLPKSKFVTAPSLNSDNDLLIVRTPSNELSVNNVALSIRDEIITKNGIIHIMDAVIIPSSMMKILARR